MVTSVSLMFFWLRIRAARRAIVRRSALAAVCSVWLMAVHICINRSLIFLVGLFAGYAHSPDQSAMDQQICISANGRSEMSISGQPETIMADIVWCVDRTGLTAQNRFIHSCFRISVFCLCQQLIKSVWVDHLTFCKWQRQSFCQLFKLSIFSGSGRS